MENIKLKIAKSSKTGKKINELELRRDLMFKQANNLAKKLGFQDAWVEGGGFRGKIVGFSEPSENVDLKKYYKPDKYGIFRPRASEKETWERIDKIGNINFDELHNIIGISLEFYENVGFEPLQDCYIVSISKAWKKKMKENKDIEEIKMSEYYLLKGE